jgi:homoserine kinase
LQSIVVRAPATSANLGPGFDCLGLALDLWNEVAAVPGNGEPAGDHLILRTAQTLFERLGVPYPGLELCCTNRIPMGRGLGSSSAAIVCGLLIANAALQRPFDTTGLLELATEIEGHPDNVAPCLLGGVQVATRTDDGHVVQISIPLATPLEIVVFVPDQSVLTTKARAVLPRQVPMADAIFNIGRASLLVAALSSGELDALAEATRDRLHQPYRLPLFPAGAALLEAAKSSGASGAFVSGAGPSVLAICADKHAARAVASAFEDAAREHDVPGMSLNLPLVQRGAYVVD